MLGPEQLEALAARAVEHFRRPDYVPPMLPAVALEVMDLSRRPNVDVRDMARTIETDPMLAARILRLAQTPLYATRAPARTIADAVVRLGMAGISHILMEVAMLARVFRAPGFEGPMNQVRVHSQAVAHTARVVAARAGLDAESAFLPALLHDVGAAAILIMMSESRHSGAQPNADVLGHLVRTAHAEVSGILARHWGFPEEIQAIVAGHHDGALQGSGIPLFDVVVVADWLVLSVSEYSLLEPVSRPDSALDALRLPSDVQAELLAEVARIRGQLAKN